MIKINSIPPSTQDLKPSSRISVVFTPTGPLVYQWQIENNGEYGNTNMRTGRHNELIHSA